MSIYSVYYCQHLTTPFFFFFWNSAKCDPAGSEKHIFKLVWPYFDQLEDLLPALGGVKRLFIQMIKDCLGNAPTQRPTAEHLVRALEGIKGAIEGKYGELATVDAVRQMRRVKALRSRSDNKVNQLAAKDEQIQELQLQLVVRL